MKDLNTCREEIDALDTQLLDLFEKRMHVAHEVVTYKLAHDLPIFQKEREVQVLKKNLDKLKDPSLKDYVHQFLSNNMNLSKSYQATFLKETKLDVHTPKRTAVRVGTLKGYEYLISHRFTDVSVSTGDTSKLLEEVKGGMLDYAVLPLSSSAARAFNETFDRIFLSDLYITQEEYNDTNYIIVSRDLEEDENANCVACVFTLRNEPGALYEAVTILKQHGINCWCIQSRPLTGKKYPFDFYLELNGTLNQGAMLACLRELDANTMDFKILGSFERKIIE